MAAGMGWFLVTLFLARLLFNGALTLSRRGARPDVVLAGICAACTLAGWLWTLTGTYLPGNIELALFCQQYMCVGYLFFNKAAHKAQALPWPRLLGALLVIGAVWFVCAQHSSLSLAGRRFTNLPVLEVASFAGMALVLIVSMLVARLSRGGKPALIRRGLVFAGQNSMALFCIHALDWSFTWDPLPALAALPFPHGLSGAVRVARAFAVLCAIRAGLGKVSAPAVQEPPSPKLP